MTLRTRLGEVRGKLLCSLHRRPIPVEGQAVVSFCFDDFPRTAYTAGGSILKSYGARGTYYASLGLMNTTNELGEQMRQADIDSVLSDGHELGCHTFSHSSCRRVPFALFERDVLTGRYAIRKMTGTDAPSFAYPFGHVSVSSKKKMGTHMKSCRGIYPGINSPDADLNLLRANSIYGDVDQFDRIESLLLENERARGWLIFYTHDVRRCPSPFGTTPALFDMAVSMTKEKGFRIAPVGEVVSIAELSSHTVPNPA